MRIKLTKPFASNGKADEFDVRQMKKALNRLGYYQPYEKTGITGIPDAEIFAGLRKFQQDHGLLASGAAKPDDETVRTLNNEAAKKSSGQYIWRTAQDDKVRPSHAALNGTVRDLSASPDPGEEFNCRCWAEPMNCENEFITQNAITKIKDKKPIWNWVDYLKHFRNGNGKSVTLPDTGWLGPVIEESKKQVFPKVEEQVVDLARQIGQGKLYYATENTYEFQSVSYPIGDATISSQTSGEISLHGKCLIIDAEVSYTFFDDFTDIFDIRGLNKFFQTRVFPLAFPEGTPEWLKIELQRGDWTDFAGTPYYLHGNWKTKMSGVIKRTVQD